MPPVPVPEHDRVLPGPYGGPAGPASTPGGRPVATPVGSGGPNAFPLPSGPTEAAVATLFLPIEDRTSWQTWWSFNRDALLGVKAALDVPLVETGDDEFFIGRGERKLAPAGQPLQRAVRELVLPALLRTLADESSAAARSQVLLALARIGASDGNASIERVLTEHIAAPELEVAQSAIVGLGILGRPTAVKTLEHVLGDCDQGRALTGRSRVPRRMRSFAAYAIGLTALRSEHEDARRFAAMYLTATLDAWRSSDDLQVACVSSLGIAPVAFEGAKASGAAHSTSSREALVARMLELLDSRRASWQTKAHAPTALARLVEGAPEELRATVCERLMRALRPRSTDVEEVRRSSILALGALGTAGLSETDVALRETLIQAMHTGPQASRNFARLALGRVGGRAAPAGNALAATPFVRKELTRELARAKGTSRAWTALALGLLERGVAEAGEEQSGATRSALELALGEASSPSDRAALGLALGLYGDPAASKLLVEQFGELRDDDLRGSMALGLGLMGAEDSIDEIEAAMRAAVRRPLLLQECALALALVGDRTVVGDLIEMLDQASDVTSRAAIAGALGQVGDQSSIEPLVAMLKGTSTDCIAAARALGVLCDEAPLPWSASLSTDMNYLAATESLVSSGVGVLDLR